MRRCRRNRANTRLGHRLITAQPDACCGELDEREEVCGVLFISGGDGPVVLEPVEEALDEVSVSIQEAAEGRLSIGVQNWV